MQKATGYFQMILAYGLIGAVLVTFIVPTINRMLLSPPVSFGVNCEPAAAWSTNALIKSQSVGILLGMLAGVVISIVWRRRKGLADTAAPTGPAAGRL